MSTLNAIVARLNGYDSLSYPNGSDTIAYRILTLAVTAILAVGLLVSCCCCWGCSLSEFGYDSLPYPNQSRLSDTIAYRTPFKQPQANELQPETREFSYFGYFSQGSCSHHIIISSFGRDVLSLRTVGGRGGGQGEGNQRFPLARRQTPAHELLVGPGIDSTPGCRLTAAVAGCTLMGMAANEPPRDYQEITNLEFDRFGRYMRGTFGLERNLLTSNLIRRIYQQIDYTPEVVQRVLRQADAGHFGLALEMYQKMISSDTEIGSACEKRQMTGRRATFTLHPSSEDKTAEVIKDYCVMVLNNMIGWKTAPFDLIEGMYTGFNALELEWWKSYPVALHPTNGSDWMWQSSPTGRTVTSSFYGQGLLWRDYNYSWQQTPPNKFVIVTPDHTKPVALRGAMRSCASWYVMKQLVAITFGSYCELYGLPQVDFEVPVSWFNDDVKLGIIADNYRKMGSEGFTVSTADMKVTQLRGGGTGTVAPHEQFLDHANRQCDNRLLGTTLQTDSTKATGSRGAAEVYKDVTADIAESDLEVVTESLQRDLIDVMVYFGFGPEAEPPILKSTLRNRSRELQELERLERAQRIGMKVSEQYAAAQTGIPIPEDGDIVLAPTETETGGTDGE